jgi:hypothetical protein
MASLAAGKGHVVVDVLDMLLEPPLHETARRGMVPVKVGRVVALDKPTVNGLPLWALNA